MHKNNLQHESTKASTTEVQTKTSRIKSNAQKCREYRERKKLQKTMVQNITAVRSDECSEADQLQAKKPKTNAERRKKHYEAQKLKKQKCKKLPKSVKQKNKEYYNRKKERLQALNNLNHYSDVINSKGHNFCQSASHQKSPQMNDDSYYSSFLSFCNDKHIYNHETIAQDTIARQKTPRILNYEVIDRECATYHNIYHSHLRMKEHDTGNPDDTIDNNSGTCENVYDSYFEVAKQELDIPDETIDKSNGHCNNVIKDELDVTNEHTDNAWDTHKYNNFLKNNRNLNLTDKTIDKNSGLCGNVIKEELDISYKTTDNATTSSYVYNTPFHTVKEELDFSNKTIDINAGSCNIKIKEESDISHESIDKAWNTSIKNISDKTIDKASDNSNYVYSTPTHNVKQESENSAEGTDNVCMNFELQPCAKNNIEIKFKCDFDDEETLSCSEFGDSIMESLPECSEQSWKEDLIHQPSKEREKASIGDCSPPHTSSAHRIQYEPDDEETRSSSEFAQTLNKNSVDTQPSSSGQDLLDWPRIKHEKHNFLTWRQKQEVINLHNYIRATWSSNEYPYKTRLIQKTSKTLGISSGTVFRIMKEYEREGAVKARKNRVKQSDKLTDFQKKTILNKAISIIKNGESLTLAKMLQAVNNDVNLPSFKKTTFHRLFKLLKLDELANSQRDSGR
ncbi:uncharacterized protein LOC112046168 [Bicyclus anynana]|uniref:Uncharacterized protein LOC112046168 n=1 Tax=Bicyclus anynana TaxID=110368 RepID=A0ABM3M5K4_BICAN|nr:uncharacterized protein LOC112046168 [Bicyclus anynana]